MVGWRENKELGALDSVKIFILDSRSLDLNGGHLD